MRGVPLYTLLVPGIDGGGGGDLFRGIGITYHSVCDADGDIGGDGICSIPSSFLDLIRKRRFDGIFCIFFAGLVDVKVGEHSLNLSVGYASEKSLVGGELMNGMDFCGSESLPKPELKWFDPSES